MAREGDAGRLGCCRKSARAVFRAVELGELVFSATRGLGFADLVVGRVVGNERFERLELPLARRVIHDRNHVRVACPQKLDDRIQLIALADLETTMHSMVDEPVIAQRAQRAHGFGRMAARATFETEAHRVIRRRNTRDCEQLVGLGQRELERKPDSRAWFDHALDRVRVDIDNAGYYEQALPHDRPLV